MDFGEVGHALKILQIVPDFEEGGVERHVLELIRELEALGHDLTLATAGGRLEAALPNSVKRIHLPVQRKNPITGLFCASYLAIRSRSWDLLHAHSRVPAWIAWWASVLSGIPWVMTAHALYSRNAGLAPLSRAKGVICVSPAVRKHLEEHLPPHIVVIPNGLPPTSTRWEGRGFPDNPRFLFVGRLTRIKGLDTVIRALEPLANREWILDVIGDGPQRAELEALSRKLNLGAHIVFHGFRNDSAAWMARSGCLLFPSFSEGMGLVVMEALNLGLPVLSSSLEPLLPMASGPLLPPGDVDAWSNAIAEVLEGGPASPLEAAGFPTSTDMAQATDNFYKEVLDVENSSLCR